MHPHRCGARQRAGGWELGGAPRLWLVPTLAVVARAPSGRRALPHSDVVFMAISEALCNVASADASLEQVLAGRLDGSRCLCVGSRDGSPHPHRPPPRRATSRACAAQQRGALAAEGSGAFLLAHHPPPAHRRCLNTTGFLLRSLLSSLTLRRASAQRAVSPVAPPWRLGGPRVAPLLSPLIGHTTLEGQLRIPPVVQASWHCLLEISRLPA
jgi:hypothetical protein